MTLANQVAEERMANSDKAMALVIPLILVRVATVVMVVALVPDHKAVQEVLAEQVAAALVAR